MTELVVVFSLLCLLLSGVWFLMSCRGIERQQDAHFLSLALSLSLVVGQDVHCFRRATLRLCGRGDEYARSFLGGEQSTGRTSEGCFKSLSSFFPFFSSPFFFGCHPPFAYPRPRHRHHHDPPFPLLLAISLCSQSVYCFLLGG